MKYLWISKILLILIIKSLEKSVTVPFNPFFMLFIVKSSEILPKHNSMVLFLNLLL